MMGNVRATTFGNLALAPEAPCRPALRVVEGTRRATAPRVRSREIPRDAPLAFASTHARPASRRSMACALIGCMLLGALFIAALVGGPLAHARAFDRALVTTQQEHLVVGAGDSLWAIAHEHPVDGLTTEQTKELIKEWNGLSSGLLTTGAELVVPA